MSPATTITTLTSSRPTHLGPPPTLPPTFSPPLHHFTPLLHSLSHSESSLSSLRAYLVSELALLHTYFSSAQKELSALAPLAKMRADDDDDRRRRVAAEKRRQKWAEMEQMRRYEEEVKRAWENLEKREEVERAIRERVAEVAELLLVREGLCKSAAGGMGL
ncbi:hypothetical protein BDZ91DRAFT_816769 [Kalaharituber pfeilii]|nr:hypothetical protein BDZ91DRAFT_816769 [Kalaharituber pfeilii]